MTPPDGFPRLREDTGPADPAADVPATSQSPEPDSLANAGSEAGPVDDASVTATASVPAAASAPADFPAETQWSGTETAPAPTADEPVNGSAEQDLPPWGEQTESDEYWEANVDARLAGQVYPVETADTTVGLPSDRDDNGDANGSAPPPQPPELDDDAPPFATAPFATIPRLNRVRATPIPPEDTDADDRLR